MNLAPIDQILQYAVWFLALIEFILGIYVLLLNAWHISNRHVSGLLLLFAANSLAVGVMAGATNAAQAAWPSYVLAATSPVVNPGLLLVVVILLKPDWLRGRWRWVWWSVYGLVLWPVLLTLADVWIGTRFWYTGLNAETYAGGYVSLAEYTAGSLAPFLRVLNLQVAAIAVFIPLLYVALLDKRATRLARQISWLFLGSQTTVMVVMFGLSNLLAGEVSVLISNAVFVLAYAYAAFRQMISERRAQRGRLPVRLLTIILAIVIPVFVTVMVVFFARARVEIENAATERLHSTNRALAANVSVWLNLNIEALRQLVILPDIVGMDAEQQKPILEAMAAAHPHMYLVSTTDLTGVNVARNDDAESKDYSDRAWFLGARNGVSVTLQSLVGRTSGEPALVASIPIRNAAGEIVGVGMFASDLTDVAREVRASQLGETGVVYVVDGDNRVIAHPDPAFSAELRDLSSYPPIVALREGAGGLVEFTDEEGRRWRAQVSTLDNGWGVVVQQEEAELTKPLRQFQMVVWAAAIVSVLLLGVMVSLALRQALQPIGALTETAMALAGGDLTRVVPVESEDEFGVLATTFNQMTEQLRGLVGSLEQRVADRTRDLERRARYLEASALVARDATSVLEPQQLLERVTSLISSHFDFYHAGIFLLDEAKEWAVLQAASSAGGQRMLARNHRLRVGEVGIVGYVTGRGEARVALDVGRDAVFFDNPDLPDTRSEMALPLRARGEIIGALDVQSTEPEAFSEEDVAVLQTLADQVAMAISNVRLYQQVQESLMAERRAYGELGREAWVEVLRSQLGLGYTSDADGVRLVTGRSGAQSGDGLSLLEIPVAVRGQVIGTISARKPDGAGEWTGEEIGLMETLTEQLSVALESARLYRDTQLRVTRERLTGEITARIRETLDMDTVLKTAVQEVRRALNLPEVVIRLAARPEGERENSLEKWDEEFPYRGWSSGGGDNA